DPVPRPGEHVDAVVAVTDEHVSKTHLTVRVGPGHVVVTDRGSTNGTVAHHPDGTVHRPRPGEPHPLPTGAVVVLGATRLTAGDPAGDVEPTVLRTPWGTRWAGRLPPGAQVRPCAGEAAPSARWPAPSSPRRPAPRGARDTGRTGASWPRRCA